MAGRQSPEEVLNARISVAKARLTLLAAAADARPGVAEQAVGWVRRWPWHGVGLALVLGVALGSGRGRVLRRLVPLAAPVLTEWVTGRREPPPA